MSSDFMSGSCCTTQPADCAEIDSTTELPTDAAATQAAIQLLNSLPHIPLVINTHTQHDTTRETRSQSVNSLAASVLCLPSRSQDFTYVVYDSSSPHSFFLAYLTFLPVLIGFGLFNTVLLRRDLEAAYHCCGLLLSTALNNVLKRLIRQPRPTGSAKLGHGMPSDHAQFSFFFVVYMTYWITYR